VNRQIKASPTGEDPSTRLDPLASEADTQAVARSSRQTAVGQVVTQGVRFLTSIVLARLLTPEDFGVVAVALVLATLIDTVQDLGMGAAIIQRRTVDQVLLNSVFYLNVAIGALLATGMLLFASPLAEALGNRSATTVIQAYAAITFVTALGQIHQSILRRKMQFRKIAWVTAASAVITASISLIGAIAGMNYWALVLGAAVGAMAGTIMLWGFDQWRPSRHVSSSSLASIWGFGWHTFMTNLLYFSWTQIDKVIVGRGAGSAALGIYTIGQRVISTPLSAISSVIDEVTFPAFSRRQDENGALRSGFTRSSAVIALMTFPLMAGAAAVATPMVAVVFGPKWSDLAPVIHVLALAGAIQSVTFNCGQILFAKGRADWSFRWGILHLIVLSGLEIVFVRWGAVGVAFGYATGLVLITPFTLILTFHLIEMRLRDYFVNLFPYIWMTAAMTISVILTSWWCRSAGGSNLAELITGVITGILVYGVLLRLIRPPALVDAIKALRGVTK
jgi:O-antigen/teichoic acid export membrane protein